MLPETYSDGWKRESDDEFAHALFLAMTGEDDADGSTWAAMREWQRDEYRSAARVARETLDRPAEPALRVTQAAQIKRMRAALEHYADKETWRGPIDDENMHGDDLYVGNGPDASADGYTVAREALADIGPAEPAELYDAELVDGLGADLVAAEDQASHYRAMASRAMKYGLAECKRLRRILRCIRKPIALAAGYSHEGAEMLLSAMEEMGPETLSKQKGLFVDGAMRFIGLSKETAETMFDAIANATAED